MRTLVLGDRWDHKVASTAASSSGGADQDRGAVGGAISRVLRRPRSSCAIVAGAVRPRPSAGDGRSLASGDAVEHFAAVIAQLAQITSLMISSVTRLMCPPAR